MPTFYFHFNDGKVTTPSELGLEYPTFEAAYIGACAAIPDVARDLLIKRCDPLRASFIITDAKGRTLMSVPFTEILKSREWHPLRARRRPYGGGRSAQVRNDLALRSFRLMFSEAPAGCVLLTPEMHVVEINDFGARHSHVDAEAIRGQSIFEIFELKGEPKENFDAFMSLAQAGVASQMIDLPYLVQDDHGQTANGWWKARTWPIFDEDQNLLGFVDWAEPSTKPTQGGVTRVGISKSRD